MTSERKFIAENIRRVLLKEYLMKKTERAGFGDLDIQRTPLGTRVTLVAERPGLVIGRKGGSIKELTKVVEEDFKFDNPQIEVQEDDNPSLNPQIMAAKLVSALERGWHFRRAGHSTVRQIMSAGAKGCQVIISGKLTGQRHRVEKFKQGHIKFCGEPKKQWMREGFAVAKKKLGIIGVKVQIMDPNAKLPDEVDILPDTQIAGLIKAREEQLAAEEAAAAAAAEEAAAVEEEGSTIEIKTEDGQVIAPDDVAALTADKDSTDAKPKRKKAQVKKDDDEKSVEEESAEEPTDAVADSDTAADADVEKPAEISPDKIEQEVKVDEPPIEQPAVVGPAEAPEVTAHGSEQSATATGTAVNSDAEPPVTDPVVAPAEVPAPAAVEAAVTGPEPAVEPEKAEPVVENEQKGDQKVSEKGDKNAE